MTGMLASTLATLLLTGALVAPSRGQGEFRIVVRLGSGDGSDAIDAKDVERLMAVYERRLDPDDARDVAQVELEEPNRVVVRLQPDEFRSSSPWTATLAGSIRAEDRTLTLTVADEGVSRVFPVDGGAIELDGEILLYRERIEDRLVGLTRGSLDEGRPHDAGAAIALMASDDLVELLTKPGELEFAIEAGPGVFSAAEYVSELERVRAWMQEHPDSETLVSYNALSRELGGPPARPLIRWYTTIDQAAKGSVFADREPVAVVHAEDPATRFGGNDLVKETVRVVPDEMGRRAIAFEILPSRAAAFERFTAAHVDERLAIVVDGEILTIPRIHSPLPGNGIIAAGNLAGFSQKQAKFLYLALRSGALPLHAEIETLRFEKD